LSLYVRLKSYRIHSHGMSPVPPCILSAIALLCLLLVHGRMLSAWITQRWFVGSKHSITACYALRRMDGRGAGRPSLSSRSMTDRFRPLRRVSSWSRAKRRAEAEVTRRDRELVPTSRARPPRLVRSATACVGRSFARGQSWDW
jgi:hypothetical protein